MSEAVMTLLYMSAAGAALIIIIAIIRLIALRRLPKQAFLLMWLVVVIRLLTPLGPAFRISVPLPSPADKPALIEAYPPQENDFSSVRPETPKSYEQTGTYNQVPNAAPPASFEQSSVKTGLTTAGILTIIWAAGAVMIVAFMAIMYLRGIKKFKSAVKVSSPELDNWKADHPLRRGYDIKALKGLDTPMTYGIIRPVILIPAGENVDLKYALEHEYTHMRRLDALWKLLLALTLAVHWFNPAVWLMYWLANRDIELSCDEAVIKRLGENNRGDYARALIDAEESRFKASPLFSGFGSNTTKERITEIMTFKKKSALGIIAAIIIVALLAACSTVAPTTEKESNTEAKSGTETEAPVKNDSTDSKYENKGYTLSIPEKFKDLVIVDTEYQYDKGDLFYVYEKASVEAGKNDGQDYRGIGELFGIRKVDEATLHEMLCYDMSGAQVFACDNSGNYYIYVHPTDVRFYRPGDVYSSDTEGWNNWGELNEWAWNDVRDAFIADNDGLSPFVRGNSMLDNYLARAAFMDDFECTLSTTEFGPVASDCETARPFAEMLMTGNGVTGVTYENVDISETPDGEYVVFNIPQDEERFDFFLMEGKENYVRAVRCNGEEYLMKAVMKDNTFSASDIMRQWYLSLAAQNPEIAGKIGESKSFDIDYGTSKLYSREDMDKAIDAIMATFNTWAGCEMHSIRYSSADYNNAENVKWRHEHGDGHKFTECIMFYSNFHSPKVGYGAWNQDEEYTDWNWWLGRTDGGDWELVDWGY
ncbi:MAG: M56 family metallopeptidase [Oscillospiraceae bacterium]|nr:M56 family metallopeptidase [Oscillospiraceae bacterium]